MPPLLLSPAQTLPSLVTLLGHGLTLGWLLGGPWILAVLGLLCDVLDGHLARRLGVTSDFGALYDWTVDVTVAALVAARLGLLPILVVLVPLQVLLHQRHIHFSGRALLVGAVLVHESGWLR